MKVKLFKLIEKSQEIKHGQRNGQTYYLELLVQKDVSWQPIVVQVILYQTCFYKHDYKMISNSSWLQQSHHLDSKYLYPILEKKSRKKSNLVNQSQT